MNTLLSLPKNFLIALVISFLFSITEFPQYTGITEYQYISPVPGSGLNQPETNIIIKYGAPYNSQDVLNNNFLEVNGEMSGYHKGKIILAENDKTLLFVPDQPFSEGENVFVKFIIPVRTSSGEFVPELNFNFRITKKNINKLIKKDPEKYLLKKNFEFNFPGMLNSVMKNSLPNKYSVITDSLPADFPRIEVDSLNNPTEGFIFLAPWNFPNFVTNNYLTILDNYGVPVFYRRLPSLIFDFKKQVTGVLSYYHLPTNQFFILDSSYKIIDSLFTKNGYLTDVHELIILENNHSLMMSYDFQPVAMDTVVPGGNPNAIVEGLIIQEQDENRNVIFQWRSWDHYRITDATNDVDLRDSVIDYVHGNAIEVDHDGNLLISARHMDEITKIDRQTGDIIWRWGGEHCKNNQFTFINDPIGFSHQHDIRKLPNGNLTLFDNGNLHSPPFSRVAEYQLDEINKLAFLVWQYKNEPLTFSFAMGNAQRLSNHNTFIGWGSITLPAVSEVKPDGSVALFLTLPDSILSYRAFKFPWRTNLFVSNPDSLHFGYIPAGDSLEMSVMITNNSDHQIEINDTYNRETVFKISTALPVILPPFGSDSIIIKFKPEIVNNYSDDLHLQWNTEGQRIALVIPLSGTSDSSSSVGTTPEVSEYYLSQNYPNPFNPVTTIKYRIPEAGKVSLKVYDVLGKEIVSLVNEEKPAGNYEVNFSAAGLASGIYFYKLQAGLFMETKKMVLMK